MTFNPPNAASIFDHTLAQVNAKGHSKDILGHDRINDAVDEIIPKYDDVLDINLRMSAHDRHARLGGLAYGKINKDIARLKALDLAIENISAAIRSPLEQLQQDWKGESFDAFRAQVEKVTKTLDDYAAAVKTTAAGLETAMSAIVTAYQEYANNCLTTHFNWKRESLPQEWWRMSADSAEYLAEHCYSWHGDFSDCNYNEDEYVPIIDGKLMTHDIFNNVLEKWDCVNVGDVVKSQYEYIVGFAKAERDAIHGKIAEFCDDADNLHANVGEVYDAALENLRILSEVKVFSHLQLTGAPAGSDGAGDPGGGSGGGGYPGGGGGGSVGGGSGSPEATMPPPPPDPAPEPAPVDPAAAAEPPETTVPAAAETAETVEIKDGDRTISVTSPDGSGQVKVTVDDGTGKTKTYSLDFDAASEMQPGAPAVAPGSGPDGQPSTDAAATGTEGVQEVPARSDGKCVIQDGPLTITAERPLFAPDTVMVTVDDGSGSPTTYTLDFAESAADEPAAPAAGTSPGAQAGEATPSRPGGVPAESAGQSTADAPQAAASANGSATAQPPAASAPEPTAAEHVTTAQAWQGDPSGSLSGVLVPEQQDGEAGLASAPDGPPEATGASGAGMPMMGGSGGATEAGRAGSGWSVHGDLFDSSDPVYSMHGVLGEDDLESQ